MNKLTNNLANEAHRKIGELGEERRVQMGIPAQAFAAEAGVSRDSLRRFEQGAADIAEEDLARIEKGLDWKPGIVHRVVALVNADQLVPDEIVMENLDSEDSAL